MDIYDYIKELKLKKVFTIKQLPYIEYINFYIEDLVIYKFIIVTNTTTIKKAKKLGLKSLYDIHRDINIKIKPPLKNTSKGRFILMYNPNINDITIVDGEDFRY